MLRWDVTVVGLATALIWGCGAAAPDPQAPRTFVIDDTNDPGWASGSSAFIPGQADPVAEASVDVRNTAAALPGSEQLAEAGRIQRQASMVTRRVSELRERTRSEGALVRFVCLDETLRDVDDARRMVGQRLHTLATAVEEGDDVRNHEYRILVVLGDRIRELEQRAMTCYVTPEVPADALRASGPSQPAGT